MSGARSTRPGWRALQWVSDLGRADVFLSGLVDSWPTSWCGSNSSYVASREGPSGFDGAPPHSPMKQPCRSNLISTRPPGLAVSRARKVPEGSVSPPSLSGGAAGRDFQEVPCTLRRRPERNFAGWPAAGVPAGWQAGTPQQLSLAARWGRAACSFLRKRLGPQPSWSAKEFGYRRWLPAGRVPHNKRLLLPAPPPPTEVSR